MALFKKETGKNCCGNVNAENLESQQTVGNENASVKVLGSGCKKCNELEANTKAALARLGMDTTVDHVTDFAKIASYGVMSLPALLVDGKVLSYGKVLGEDEIIALLQKNLK